MAMRIPAWLESLLGRVFGIDLRTLALFRITLGLVLFGDLVARSADLTVFYTDAGVMPRAWLLAVNGPWRISLHSANGEPWFIWTLFIIEMLAALMMVFGWRTRLATLVAFVLHASLLNRNIMVLLGGDELITCLIFWGLFLPLGARASIDAALANTPTPADNRYRSWATAGLLLQVMSVYFFSAILKNDAEWWPDGTAVDYALQIDGYATPIGHWLRNFPQLTSALTYYVYFLEWLGPILVFSPIFSRTLRFAVMVQLMLMHVGFLLCLQISPFPYISLVSLTTLVGGWLWDAADRAGQRRAVQRGGLPLRIFYDKDCGFCRKSTLLLKTLLLLPRAQIAPAQDHARAKALLEANYSWVIIDHDDRAYLKWPAYVVLLRRSPLLAPLGWLLSGAWAVKPGNAVYAFVGRHRDAFGAITAKLLPYHDRSFRIGLAGQLVSGLVLFSLLTWNLISVHWLPEAFYKPLTPPLRVIRLDQYWNMFAPFPSHEDGWFVIPARKINGEEFDLLHPERPGVSYDKPRWISREWRNIRWHKYMERIWSAEFSQNRLYFGQYLCRSWNAAHDGSKQLDTFKIIYMLERSVPWGQTPTVEQMVIWRHECFDKPAPPPSN
jgi:predicted DCC family thiol-disulfide oxidoreductase YuxK/uncharacterized membrane protein YphA (DoxX/SURF4 family)